MMRLIQLMFLASVAHAQTAVTAPQPVPVPGCIVPAQSLTITVPKGGGKISTQIPAQTCSSQTITIPAQTVSINLSGTSLSFLCKGGTETKDANGNFTGITGLNCTLTKVAQ